MSSYHGKGDFGSRPPMVPSSATAAATKGPNTRRFEDEEIAKSRGRSIGTSPSGGIVPLAPSAPFSHAVRRQDSPHDMPLPQKCSTSEMSSSYDSASVPVFAVVATPVDPTTDVSSIGGRSKQKSPFRERKVLICLAVAVLIIVGLSVIIGMTVISRKDSNASSTASFQPGQEGYVDGGEQVKEGSNGDEPKDIDSDAEGALSPTASPYSSPTTSNGESGDFDPSGGANGRPASSPPPPPTPSPVEEEELTSSPIASEVVSSTPKPTPTPTESPSRAPVTQSPTRRPTDPPTLKPTPLSTTRAPTIPSDPAPSPTSPSDAVRTISTGFSQGNAAQINRPGNMFDVQALTDVTIIGMAIHVSTTGVVPVEVWTKAGTFDGSERQQSEWTRISVQGLSVEGKGEGVPTHLPADSFEPVRIAQGATQAFYVTTTSGTAMVMKKFSGNNNAANSDLRVIEGSSNQFRFGNAKTPKMWNGVLKYHTGI